MTEFRDSSRRHFLGGAAAAALAIPSAARAVTGTRVGPQTLPQPVPPAESIQGGVDYQNRLTLDTMLDGRGPYKFVVDTGSDRSVISTELAQSLGLLNGEDMIVQGISRSMSAQSVVLKNVRFGSITLPSLAVPLIPKIWLGADGYLGIDAIDGRRVTFDFQNNRITVGGSSALSRWNVTRFAEIVVPVSGGSGRLKAADCTVDRVPVTAFIDSGAQISIGNNALFAELAKNGATLVPNVAVPVLGATGGQTYGRMTYVSNIRLSTMNYSHSNLVIADLPVFDVWGLRNQPAIFLGMNFLENVAAFTIDYARKELRFKIGAMNRLLARA